MQPRTPQNGSAPRKSRSNLQSRMGLRKPGEAPVPKKRPKPQQQPSPKPRQEPTPPRPRTQNPQKAGYRQGAPGQKRRVTLAEQVRVRRRRTVIGLVCVFAALVIGIAISMRLLFKVTDFRLENMDRSTPANTGIYSEQEIIDALGLQVGENLFDFSGTAKAQELLGAMPYLDAARVNVQIPGTVVVKVQPATERFAIEYNNTWLVLNPQRKILRAADAQPDGLILLQARTIEGQTAQPGTVLALDTYNSLDDAATAATVETAQANAADTVAAMLTSLEAYGLRDGVSVLSVEDMSELNFLYQGRISVKLGTANNLEYKIRLAAATILDAEKGLTENDHGTLDVSYTRADGDIYAYFQPAEATPEPTAAPEEEPEASAEPAATE